MSARRSRARPATVAGVMLAVTRRSGVGSAPAVPENATVPAVADTPLDTAPTGSVTPATSAAATTGNAALASSTPATGIASVTLAVPVAAAPAIGAVFGGLLLFRERLMRWQAGGAVLILAGLVLLGLGS